jgi:hypothetical protein
MSRSLQGIGQLLVTCTVSHHFPAMRTISPGWAFLSAQWIASFRSGIIWNVSHSVRAIHFFTISVIRWEDSVYVSSSVRTTISASSWTTAPIFGRFVVSRSPVAQKTIIIFLWVQSSEFKVQSWGLLLSVPSFCILHFAFCTWSVSRTLLRLVSVWA